MCGNSLFSIKQITKFKQYNDQLKHLNLYSIVIQVALNCVTNKYICFVYFSVV